MANPMNKRSPWSLLDIQQPEGDPSMLGIPSYDAAQQDIPAAAQASGDPNPFLNPSQAFEGMDLGHLAAVGKGSGLTDKRELDRKSTHNTTTQNALMLDPSQVQDAYNTWEQTPVFQDQKKGIDELQALIAKHASRPSQIDLSPIMALADAQTGSNMAASYKKPASNDDRFKQILEYSQKLQGDKRDLSKNILDSISKQRGGQTTDLQSMILNAKNAEIAADPQAHMRQIPEDTRIHWLMTSVDKDMKELKTSNDAVKQGAALLSSGASVSDTAFRDQFLKAMIGGRVSNYDLMRQSGDTSLAAKASQAWDTLTSGQLSEQNRAEYRQALETIAEANAHEAALRLARTKGIAITSWGLPEEKVNPVVSGFGIGQMPPAQKPAHKAAGAAPAAGADDMVTVINPDGVQGKIPRSKLAAALKKNYKQVGK